MQKPHVSLFSVHHHKLFANLKNENFFFISYFITEEEYRLPWQ